MRLIENKAEIIQQGEGLECLYKHIETCGRVPYKSENKSDGTVECAKAFVDRMINSRHLAVLEHGTVYLYLEVNPENAFSSFDYPLAEFTSHYNWSNVVGYIGAKYRSNPYSKVVTTIDTESAEEFNKAIKRVYITTNYRVIIVNGWQDDLQFICAPTEHHKKRYTFKVTTSIGVTREFNRHKLICAA